jgi:hypothetical protein
MKTNKKIRSRRHRHKHRHTNKMLKKKEEKDSLSRSHRRRSRRHRNKKTSLSSWDRNYNTYESDIVNSEVARKSDHNNKDNNVQAVHGLKDFLQGKKS